MNAVANAQRAARPKLRNRSSGFLVVGYHGCDAVIRDDLVNGTLKCLTPSENQYDWLGPGFYLFENDPLRALKFAAASSLHPELMYTRQAIATPATVGVVLRIQNWLDMTTQVGLTEFSDAHEHLKQLLAAADTALPRNLAAGGHDNDFILRHLDNAIFHTLHQQQDEEAGGMPFYQAVRGAFPQGDYISEHSFRSDSHIQIAVRDPGCVIGWFLPEGAKLMSPEEYALARTAYDHANRVRKPRKRA